MEKEEILEKNRKDNRRSDELELQVLGRAGTIATIVGGFLCFLCSMLEFTNTQRVTPSYWAIYFGMLTVEFIVKSVALRQKSSIILSVVYGLLTIACGTFYVMQFTGVIR